MNLGIWQLVIGVVIAGLGSAGVGEAVRAFTRRGPARVEAAAQVTSMTMKWAEALQADAEQARRKMLEVTAEADKLHAQVQLDREEMRSLRIDVTRLGGEVQQLTLRMRHWRRAILSPDATLEALRQMVATEPGENGIYSKES